jgi:hypothetical protein
VNAADQAWVDRQCTPQSLATFQQPVCLTGRVGAIDNVSFIRASGWEGSPFGPFYEQAKQVGWKTVEIACGHDVMLDRPAALTEALLSAAAPTDGGSYRSSRRTSRHTDNTRLSDSCSPRPI